MHLHYGCIMFVSELSITKLRRMICFRLFWVSRNLAEHKYLLTKLQIRCVRIFWAFGSLWLEIKRKQKKASEKEAQDESTMFDKHKRSIQIYLWQTMKKTFWGCEYLYKLSRFTSKFSIGMTTVLDEHMVGFPKIWKSTKKRKHFSDKSQSMNQWLNLIVKENDAFNCCSSPCLVKQSECKFILYDAVRWYMELLTCVFEIGVRKFLHAKFLSSFTSGLQLTCTLLKFMENFLSRIPSAIEKTWVVVSLFMRFSDL